MTQIDHELQRIERDAQRTANRNGAPVAIYNLNRAGRRLLVIRSVEEGAPAPYAGPFEPKPKWATEFPDYPADSIPSLGEGWRDASWNCEPCPSFQHEESGLILWCLHPDPAMRDFETEPHYSLVQLTERHPVHGWQHGNGEFEALRCDSLGELRDFLDSMPLCKSMADALLFARMRLNQLTAADARALISTELTHDIAGGRACPDLICQMRSLLAKSPGGLTLDGEEARLRLAGKFGFVRRADGKGGEVEYSVSAVVNVLANGGAFKS